LNSPALDIGTAGTVNADGTVTGNYWLSQFQFDSRGRQNRVLSPSGTITRTVNDGLSRSVSTWIGTNDNGATDPDPTGGGATGNNMLMVSQNVYDGASASPGTAGVGDSNVTQVTQFPADGTPNRVTQSYFDWRDRMIATKSGVQATEGDGTNRPITLYTYDNLNEVTQTDQYQGDGFSGLPGLPPAANLRGRTMAKFDDQGRVYESDVYSVDYSGTVSTNALKTYTWYSHRGQVIETLEPGGVATKNLYDGAGRKVKTYITDGAYDIQPGPNNNSWSTATAVIGNNVLSQTDTTYDNNSNVILVTQRERFHDNPLTALGVSGELKDDPMTQIPTPPHRRSYVAQYYDLADRLTDSANVGTNAGSFYTRPASVPGRSDTVLVTSNGYKADNLQKVAITGNPTGGTFRLTFTQNLPPSYPMFQTGNINYNATASDVQSALQTVLNGFGANVVLVTGAGGGGSSPGGPWLVRFTGALGESYQLDLTATPNFVGGGGISLTTLAQGGESGRVAKVTDPRALVSKTDSDLLGQSIVTVEAFDNTAAATNSNKTTEMTYDGAGHMLTLKADLPTSVIYPTGAFQTTQYVYGVATTAGGCTSNCSYLNSNDLLKETRYPDKSSGLANANDKEAFGYNALGQTMTKQDRIGNVHTYYFDVVGRMTGDAITTLAGPTDGSVRRLGTTFDSAGRPLTYTSYSDSVGTMVVNQVQETYNGLGQLTAEYQSHSGAVNLNTSLRVRYVYSEMTDDLGNYVNHSRLKKIIYPDTQAQPTGRQLAYNYNSADGLDNAVSRLTAIKDGINVLEQLIYMGSGTVVERDHTSGNTKLTYIGTGTGDAGDKYVGLDRFGRIIDQHWQQIGGSQNDTDRFQYGYDRDSNRLYRNNLVNTSFGELYHASGAGNGYDVLNQMTGFARGTLSSSNPPNGPLDTIAAPSITQNWTLDIMGNWNSVCTNPTATNCLGGTLQSRTHNQQNQITAISATSPNPAYNANGNLLNYTDPQDHIPRAMTFDAWNRLATVAVTGLGTISYKSDALNRRVQRSNGGLRDFYFSQAWQNLEERDGTNITQYVWSPVYVDALIER